MYPSKENKGKKISQSSDVLTAMVYDRRKLIYIFKIYKERKCEVKSLYPAKLTGVG